MKNFLTILIIFLIGVLVYQFRITLVEQILLLRNDFYIFFKKDPCTEPIPYNLGTFNKQFGISQNYFLDTLKDAEAIWEKPFGKDLFTYSASYSQNDVLKINLIYDYRQRATSKLAELGIVVKDDRSSYDALKEKFTALKIQYEKEKNIYEKEVTDFNLRQKAYETEVDFWNKKGGAPKQEYEKVEAERLALGVLAKILQNKQTRIGEMVDEINAIVTKLNHLVSVLNLSVDQYNTVNGSRGESFEEGVYISDGLTRQIDIYEFSSRNKLVRVLAHELGHALGLEHISDPKAMMYELNQGSSIALTQNDLVALKAKCGVK